MDSDVLENLVAVLGQLAERLATYRLMEFVVRDGFFKEYNFIRSIVDADGVEFRGSTIEKLKDKAQKVGLNMPDDPEGIVKYTEDIAAVIRHEFEFNLEAVISSINILLDPPMRLELKKKDQFFFEWALTIKDNEGNAATFDIHPQWFQLPCDKFLNI